MPGWTLALTHLLRAGCVPSTQIPTPASTNQTVWRPLHAGAMCCNLVTQFPPRTEGRRGGVPSAGVTRWVLPTGVRELLSHSGVVILLIAAHTGSYSHIALFCPSPLPASSGNKPDSWREPRPTLGGVIRRAAVPGVRALGAGKYT